MDITHVLYTLAEQADARYNETIQSRAGQHKTRWTLTPAEERIPEIAYAYRQKRNADEAWLTYLRTSR